MGEMQISYMKRVRWEARVHAVEVGKVIAELLEGRPQGGGRPQGAAPTSGERSKGERVSGAELLGEMGLKVKGTRGKTRAEASG